MNITFPFADPAGCPCHLRIIEDGPPMLALDLGVPGDTACYDPNIGKGGPSGPRIICRRTKENDGWRIYLHPMGDEHVACYLINDKDPLIATLE